MEEKMARAIRVSVRRLPFGLLALVVAALAIAGCGGGGTTSAGSSTGEASADPGGANSAVAVAEKEVSKYLKPPTSIGITEPLAKRPAPGKLIYSVACGLSPCKVLQKGATEAGEALGWTVKSLVSDGTPENIVEQVDEALSHDADGIMITGFARSSFEPALQKAVAQKVPMVNSGTPDPAKPPFIAVTIGKPVFKRNAEIMADWIVADSNADAKVAIFHVSTFPVLDYAGERLSDRIKSICSTCSVEEINSQISEVGTALPQKVVSTLQQDPSINYVFFTDASFATGVPQALGEAGLSEQVKVTVAQPTEVDLESIREGGTAAATGYPLGWNGWAGIDSFARYFNGENPKPPPLAAPTQILTQETVGETTDWEPANYQQEFLKLWKAE
jgi:ribose transport system substrate-binding protein